VLDDGEIIERGDHHSLVKQGGVYAELLRQQQLAEELERYS
jgi:ABC-type multidrug transport system fused ATPase/permease subunit